MISHVQGCLLAYREKTQFQTLSVTQNGSTAFRFVRLAVLPLFYNQNLLWIAKPYFYGIMKTIRFIDLHSRKW